MGWQLLVARITQRIAVSVAKRRCKFVITVNLKYVMKEKMQASWG